MASHAGHGAGLWDEADGFFYDVLHLPDGGETRLKVRSLVGLIPLFAVEVIDDAVLRRLPEFAGRLRWFLDYRPDLASLVSRWQEAGTGERRLLSLLRGHRMKCLLRRMLDETEFLSPHGVRAFSKAHEAEPYVLEHEGHRFGIRYVPGESDGNLFGGNSNWRGPVWMPVNYLMVESLREFHRYYGDDFKVECPVGSGRKLSLREVADELSCRLGSLFLRGHRGRRPCFGDCALHQDAPHFRDHVLFHEYFPGDTGRGVGAAYQTGRTGLVALLLHPRTEDTVRGFVIPARPRRRPLELRAKRLEGDQRRDALEIVALGGALRLYSTAACCSASATPRPPRMRDCWRIASLTMCWVKGGSRREIRQSGVRRRKRHRCNAWHPGDVGWTATRAPEGGPFPRATPGIRGMSTDTTRISWPECTSGAEANEPEFGRRSI